MKNEIGHNHSINPNLYENFAMSAVMTRQFGQRKSVTRLKRSKEDADDFKQDLVVDEESEN